MSAYRAALPELMVLLVPKNQLSWDDGEEEEEEEKEKKKIGLSFFFRSASAVYFGQGQTWEVEEC